MLVLSRKEAEAIVLPQLGVTITINRIRGNKVIVGIEAPQDVSVLRSELAERCTVEPSNRSRSLPR